MDPSPLARALGFLADFARRQAGSLVEFPGGFAVLNTELAASYVNNRLVLTPDGVADPRRPPDRVGQTPGDPGGGGDRDAARGVVATADRVLGGAGLAHRLVEAHREIDPGPFLDAGYQHSVNLVMAHNGAPGRPADPAIRVEQIEPQAMYETGLREWREQYPNAGDGPVDQLARRTFRLLAGADEVAFLGVREADRVVAHADLYLNPAQGVAQIESVLTDPGHARRGLARAVLAHALSRARAAGCDLVFLVADEDDWPQRWYARIGYAPIGRTHEFLRTAPL